MGIPTYRLLPITIPHHTNLYMHQDPTPCTVLASACHVTADYSTAPPPAEEIPEWLRCPPCPVMSEIILGPAARESRLTALLRCVCDSCSGSWLLVVVSRVARALCMLKD